jgi:hypothetical protein
MSAKITRLTLDYRSRCPKVTVVGQTSLLSCRKARKARTFTSDWEPSGESRLRRRHAAAGAPAAGVIATDLCRRTDVWLVDIGLEASLEEGAMMATRLPAMAA